MGAQTALSDLVCPCQLQEDRVRQAGAGAATSKVSSKDRTGNSILTGRETYVPY